MSYYFFRTDSQYGEGDADGTDWDDAYPYSDFETALESGSGGDNFYVGAPAFTQSVIDWQYRDSKWSPTASGTATDPLRIYFGSIGARINTNQFDLMPKIMNYGDNKTYPVSTGDFDNTDISIYMTGNYCNWAGFNMEDHGIAIEMVNNIVGVKFSDCYFRNCTYCITGVPSGQDDYDGWSNVLIENVYGVDIGNTLVQIPPNSTNVTVRNFSFDNSSVQEFQSRPINVRSACTNIVIEDGEINGSTSMYQYDNAGVPYAADTYLQGDGISTEEGDTITIRRVKCTNCTDRGFDIKTTTAMLYDCTATNCKSGVCLWGADSECHRCYVTNPRGNANDEGRCFQSVNTGQKFVDCVGILGENYVEGIFSLYNDGLVIKGGRYEFNEDRYWFMVNRGTAAINVNLYNVEINGTKYTQTVTIPVSYSWNPISGFTERDVEASSN